MSGVEPGPDEALTREEIAGTEVPGAPVASGSKPRNAFSELMSRKSPKAPAAEARLQSQSQHPFRKLYKDRDGLGAYIHHPESYPSSRVAYHNDSFVVIYDMYPKASVHTLLLPRSRAHSKQHPFDAFEDAAFLAGVRAEVAELKQHVAKELQRKFGKFSAKDAEREAVLNGEQEAYVGADGKPRLPAGRDWLKEVVAGIHAGPSMNHVHVHVLSRDMFSEKVKHRKHYNSFNTPFLVDIADFPLPKDDVRRHKKGAFLSSDLVCWRCGKNFVNQFAKLKAHLAVEFEAWKKE
ncbi:Aprataxin-like protein [Zalerion maritima]|uniref:Aprataxin-like protein n=1 Tax=Zalerion maritima TaxID=339359 RepID=A0AAD5S5L1_9PEZI|nr:Aprataxin-like protein [Zalerion maritima]